MLNFTQPRGPSKERWAPHPVSWEETDRTEHPPHVCDENPLVHPRQGQEQTLHIPFFAHKQPAKLLCLHWCREQNLVGLWTNPGLSFSPPRGPWR